MKLSIIIATHARPDSLMCLIGSLAPQLRPDSHELLIAENGTPTPLPLNCARVIHLHDPQPGKCRIQNRAITRASGGIIACLDDDLITAPDYVAEVERFFDTHPEFAAMKGRILPQEDPLRKIGPAAAYLDLPIADHGDDVIEVRGVMGANMAFRASALRRVGPFDERLGPGAAGHEEETELSQRLHIAGLRIGYAPRALVYHEVDPARADRERFIRIARERGFCRTLHEFHTPGEVALNVAIASARLAIARALRTSTDRVAREERRLAIARGMRDGLRAQRNQSDDSSPTRPRP